MIGSVFHILRDPAARDAEDETSKEGMGWRGVGGSAALLYACRGGPALAVTLMPKPHANISGLHDPCLALQELV